MIIPYHFGVRGSRDTGRPCDHLFGPENRGCGTVMIWGQSSLRERAGGCKSWRERSCAFVSTALRFN